MLSGTAAVLIWHNLVKPLGGVFAIYELLPAFLLAGVAGMLLCAERVRTLCGR